MAKKMIKVLLYTFFDEVETPAGIHLQERLGRHGEEVEVTRDFDLQRGEELNAFYTSAEAKAIKDGTYSGPDAATVYAARNNERPPSLIQDIEGEGAQDITELTSEQIAAIIYPNKFGQDGKKLNVEDTLALAGDGTDLDLLNKLADAENLATDNQPREGVISALEAKMAAATQQ